MGDRKVNNQVLHRFKNNSKSSVNQPGSGFRRWYKQQSIHTVHLRFRNKSYGYFLSIQEIRLTTLLNVFIDVVVEPVRYLTSAHIGKVTRCTAQELKTSFAIGAKSTCHHARRGSFSKPSMNDAASTVRAGLHSGPPIG